MKILSFILTVALWTLPALSSTGRNFNPQNRVVPCAAWVRIVSNTAEFSQTVPIAEGSLLKKYAHLNQKLLLSASQIPSLQDLSHRSPALSVRETADELFAGFDNAGAALQQIEMDHRRSSVLKQILDNTAAFLGSENHRTRLKSLSSSNPDQLFHDDGGPIYRAFLGATNNVVGHFAELLVAVRLNGLVGINYSFTDLVRLRRGENVKTPAANCGSDQEIDIVFDGGKSAAEVKNLVRPILGSKSSFQTLLKSLKYKLSLIETFRLGIKLHLFVLGELDMSARNQLVQAGIVVHGRVIP